MGVPIFTIYDTTKCLHVTNVTTSLLKNSNLDEYICTDNNDVIFKINNYIYNPNLKKEISTKFLEGKVCDKVLYTRSLEKLFTELFNKHK